MSRSVPWMKATARRSTADVVAFLSRELESKTRGEQPQYTIIIVTHELNEAIYVADRVIGLSRFYTEGSQVVHPEP